MEHPRQSFDCRGCFSQYQLQRSEVAFEQTFKSFAVTGLIFGHFVDGVMDGIVTEFFGAFGEVKFTGAGTAFGFSTHLQIFLGAGGEDFAEEFGKFGGVFGFFKGVAFVGFGDFGVAFAFSLTAHGEVHTDFAALTLKVGFETGDDFGIDAFGGGDDVFASVALGAGDRFEFSSRSFALGAVGRSFITFVDLTANGAYILHSDISFS